MRVSRILVLLAGAGLALPQPVFSDDRMTMAEHFAMCSGLFAAAEHLGSAAGKPAQAKEYHNLSNGAEVAAALLAGAAYGGDGGLSWAASKREAQKDHFLADLERSDGVPSQYFEERFSRCLSTLDAQEGFLNAARDLMYNGARK